MEQDINALSASKCNNLISCASDKAITNLFIGSLTARNRKHILLSYFRQFLPVNIDNNQKQAFPKSVDDVDIFTRMGNVIRRKSSICETKCQIKTSKICKMPLELVANIMSFMNMNDRLLNCERVCNKFYNICQMQQAKSQLIINKSFVRNALNDNIDIYKFKDIEYLCINFVFCNPMKQKNTRYTNNNDLESKYYKILNELISNCPNLKTLKYDLTENAFRSHLGDSTKWNKQYYGNLFHFVSNLPNLYQCTKLEKLIWIEKKYKEINCSPGGGKSANDVHQWLVPHDDVSKFVDIFKHIKSLSIPNHLNLSSYPLVSQIWNNKIYHKNLKYLHINLKDIVNDDNNNNQDDDHDDDDDDDDIVRQVSHPLTNFHKYQNLESLQLTLPIFQNCSDYYHAILEKLNKHNCKLTDISLDFEIDSYVTNLCTLNIIEEIWNYILEHCTKIANFKCIINNHKNDKSKKLKIKHSYLSKLNTQSIQSLHYKSYDYDVKCFVSSLNKVNFIHLKELTLGMQHNSDRDVSYYLKKLKLSKLKSLQSFKLYLADSSRVIAQNNLIANIIKNTIEFLEYIKTQKKLSKNLRHIQLIDKRHRNENYLSTNGRKKIKKFKLNQMESQKICKILSEITANHEKIKCIELNPIAIHENQLKYLYFWFGHLDVTQWYKFRKSYFVDLKLENKQHKF